MELYLLVLVFVFGTLIGSFLNVVIYRLHTGRSVNGRSHCMSCGETLQWYELFPIVSYFVLRARCRSCGAYIPFRYLMVELLTGFTFLMLYTLQGDTRIPLLFSFVLASILIVIVVYDLRHTIIPDELTVATILIALFMVGYDFLCTSDAQTVLVRVLGGLGAALFFFMLWFVSKGRWLGLGDAKLALPLGMIAGSGALSMVVLSFWIGALVSVLLLLFLKLFEKGKTVLHFLPRKLTMKSEVPFAPFLILGFLLVHYFHADIFVITTLFLSFIAI